METGIRTGKGVGAVLVLVAVAAIAGAANPATAGQKAKKAAKVTKIKMVETREGPAFRAPPTVRKGTKLRIVNRSNPRKVGPHTFTLVTSRNLPRSEKQMKRCEQRKGVCGDIAAAHEFDPKTFTVSKPNVEAGKPGWDKRFGKTGDSWYTERRGEITGRVVSAKAGTVLRFFCAVHPFMHGKIKVVK